MRKLFADPSLNEIYDLGVDEATICFAHTLSEYANAMKDMGLTEQAKQAADMADEILTIFEKRNNI